MTLTTVITRECRLINKLVRRQRNLKRDPQNSWRERRRSSRKMTDSSKTTP